MQQIALEAHETCEAASGAQQSKLPLARCPYPHSQDNPSTALAVPGVRNSALAGRYLAPLKA